MFGLFAIIAVQVAFIGACSYWMSWDMQHKDRRPTFTAQLRNDLVDFMRKNSGAGRNRASRSVAAEPVQARAKNRPLTAATR